jgi:hypothetical protein
MHYYHSAEKNDYCEKPNETNLHLQAGMPTIVDRCTYSSSEMGETPRYRGQQHLGQIDREKQVSVRESVGTNSAQDCEKDNEIDDG